MLSGLSSPFYTLSVFFVLSPSTSSCAVIDAISVSINQAISQHHASQVLVFGDFTMIIRSGWIILVILTSLVLRHTIFPSLRSSLRSYHLRIFRIELPVVGIADVPWAAVLQLILQQRSYPSGLTLEWKFTSRLVSTRSRLIFNLVTPQHVLQQLLIVKICFKKYHLLGTLDSKHLFHEARNRCKSFRGCKEAVCRLSCMFNFNTAAWFWGFLADCE